jgi:hypothetical protein
MAKKGGVTIIRQKRSIIAKKDTIIIARQNKRQHKRHKTAKDKQDKASGKTRQAKAKT